MIPHYCIELGERTISSLLTQVSPTRRSSPSANLTSEVATAAPQWFYVSSFLIAETKNRILHGFSADNEILPFLHINKHPRYA